MVRTQEAPIPPTLAKRSASVPAIRSSEEEIKDRRRRVVRLRMRGLGYRTIAKKLGVGHMTIKRDLEAIREENKRCASEFDRQEHAGESLTVYQEVELRAWQDYQYAPKGSNERQKFLAEVRAARHDQTKLMMDLGIISKAPTESKITISSEVIQHWSPEAQDLVALAILKSSMKSLPEPRPDTIDVEALPVKEKSVDDSHAEPSGSGAFAHP